MIRLGNLLMAGGIAAAGLAGLSSHAAEGALPSWNDSAAKTAIITFVERVTGEGGPDFVPPAERIAVFDNDGTLWAEQPMYFQMFYILDRIKELAPQHPEWKSQEPFASVLQGDVQGALAGGNEAILGMAMATHAGMTEDEFRAVVGSWLASAKHPTSGKLYTQMIYQPMLEVLQYLRANQFKTYITSGGGIDFIRLFSEDVYGIPPEQVIGTSIEATYEVRDGQPVVVKIPKLDLLDDKEGKPVAIHRYIGRRPIAAFGNSDGDFQMLEYTTAGPGPRLGVLVHHTDADREWAYDRESHIGQLAKGLDEAADRGWIIVDMKDDWQTVFPD